MPLGTRMRPSLGNSRKMRAQTFALLCRQNRPAKKSPTNPPTTAPPTVPRGPSALPNVGRIAVQPTRIAALPTDFNPPAVSPCRKSLTADIPSGMPATRAPAGPPMRATLPRIRSAGAALLRSGATLPSTEPTLLRTGSATFKAEPVLVNSEPALLSTGVVSLPRTEADLLNTGSATLVQAGLAAALLTRPGRTFCVTWSAATPVRPAPNPSTAFRKG